MRVVPTRDEVFRRWLETPWSGIRRGARWAWTKYRAHAFPLTGLAVGLLVPLLGLLYHQVGTVHHLIGHLETGSATESARLITARLLSVPYAFTMLFAELANLLGMSDRGLAPIFGLSTALTAVAFWLVGVLTTWSRRHGRPGRIVVWVVILLVASGFAWTWISGTEAARRSIREQCRKLQTRAHLRLPDVVPAEPIEPEIYYCFPILPGVVASEHCFLYGPLMGDGGRRLSLWNGASVRTAVEWPIHH